MILSCQRTFFHLLSFIGGKPRIPSGLALPVCKLCNNEQTFYFQVTFPEEHYWSGLSLAVFACTRCQHRDFLIPAMLKGALQGIDIPQSFLTEYQINFKFLVFESSLGIVRNEYVEKVKFKRFRLHPHKRLNLNKTKIGGSPNWVLEDESPGAYNSKMAMKFLLQIVADFRFDLVPNAPRQMEYNYFKRDLEPSSKTYYQLFLGNATYFFGTENRNEPLVYAITQVD